MHTNGDRKVSHIPASTMNFGQKRVTEAVGNLSGNTFMKYIDNGSRVMKSLRTSTLPLNLSSQKENELTYSVTSYAR